MCTKLVISVEKSIKDYPSGLVGQKCHFRVKLAPEMTWLTTGWVGQKIKTTKIVWQGSYPVLKVGY